MIETKICPFCGKEIEKNATRCRYCGNILSGSGSSVSVEMEKQVRLALSLRYKILEVIGKGGMATVYKAIQLNLNRIVALKVIHPNLVYDEEFLARFHREARTAASLNHPNIVMIIDEGVENGIHFMAMEYLEGDDLRNLIKRKGTLSVDEVVRIIAPIAEALDYVHLKGLVHRDVKSANIFITKEGRPVLTDFGIAHAASGTRLTQAGTVIGTPEYMSPEQAEGKEIDGRSDLFSLGIVMFECLTGRVPFKGDNPLTTIHKIIYDNSPTIRKMNIRVPGWMENIVNRTLEKSLEKRVPNGQLLAMKLREGKSFSGSFKRDQIRANSLQYNPYLASPVKKRENKAILMILVLVVVLMMAATLVYFNGNAWINSADPAYLTEDSLNVNEQFMNYLEYADQLYTDGNLQSALENYKMAYNLQSDNEYVKNRIDTIQKQLLQEDNLD